MCAIFVWFSKKQTRKTRDVIENLRCNTLSKSLSRWRKRSRKENYEEKKIWEGAPPAFGGADRTSVHVSLSLECVDVKSINEQKEQDWCTLCIHSEWPVCECGECVETVDRFHLYRDERFNEKKERFISNRRRLWLRAKYWNLSAQVSNKSFRKYILYVNSRI